MQQPSHIRSAPSSLPLPEQPASPARPPRRAPRRETFRRRIVSMLLAFALGAAVALGGAGIAVAVLFAQPARNTLSLLGIDAEAILSEEYLDLSLSEAVDAIGSDLAALSDADGVTLGVLARYSPAVEEIAQAMSGQLREMGVSMTADDLLAIPLGEMGSALRESILGADLGTALGLNAMSDALLLELCYGEAGEDYTILGGHIVMNAGKQAATVGDLAAGATELLKKLKVETAFGVSGTSSEILRFLAYGREGEQYIVTDGMVVMRTDPVTGERYEKRTLADLADPALFDGVTVDYGAEARLLPLSSLADKETGLTAACADVPLCELADALGSVCLDDIAAAQDAAPVLAALAGIPLADADGAFDALPLSEALPAAQGFAALACLTMDELPEGAGGVPLSCYVQDSSSRVLSALCDATAVSLGARLAQLTVRDVLPEAYAVFVPSRNGGMTFDETVAAYDPAADVRRRPVPLEGEYSLAEKDDGIYATWTENGVTHTERAELRAYGVWHYLPGDETPLCELPAALGAVQDALSDAPLWELHLYGVLEDDPYAPYEGGNLNLLTLNETAALCKALLQNADGR